MTRQAILTLVLITAAAAHAQGPTPIPTPQPPLPPPVRGHSYEMRIPSIEGGPAFGGSTMGIVPSGTWWRNPDTIRDLNLSTDQQKKMEDIFRQNRIQLIDLKASLEKEQLNLEPILNNNPPDQGKAIGEISKIADLRAELEKANARMLLGLRAQLTADQWTKLQTMKPSIFHMENWGRGAKGSAFLFKKGEARNTNTTTCTTAAGQPGQRCVTTTVTVKDDNGRPSTTTCVTEPGATTPRCTTSTAGRNGSFLLTLPRANEESHPKDLILEVPSPSPM